jgi:hypothetical protein
MPGSLTTVNGTPSHVQMLSRTPLVADPASPGTFFIAYPAGYPTTSKVLLWRVGDAGSTTIVDEPTDHAHAAVAADANGVWVFWSTSGADSLMVSARHIDRSGNLGFVQELGAPSGAQTIHALDGEVNPGGEPEVLALAGMADGTSATYYFRHTPLPDPSLGETVNLTPVKGEVLVRLPGQQEWVPLSVVAHVPVGTEIDSRKGTLWVASASARLRAG